MQDKTFQAKRKHHYVWANYLKRWSTNGRDIYYTTITGKIKYDSVLGLAMDKDFYQLKPIDSFQLEVIKRISAQSPEKLQEQHKAYFSDFCKLQQAEEAYNLSATKNMDVEKAIHATKCNLLENLHACCERDAWPILNELTNGNLNILDDDKNMIKFMVFLGHQVTRTKNFKDIAILATSNNSTELGIKFKKAMEDAWWFISYMYGMNFGASLYFSRKQENHSLLLNNTSVPFITSDQPLINVHPSIRDDVFKAPSESEFDFYYPISPKYAYFISASHRFEKGIIAIDENTVIELNTKLSKHAITHIFSDRKEILEPYKKLVGQNIKKAGEHFENIK
ncbi:MAG: hypothetical protein C0446_14625 [Chitinophaga sp.]|uniref:DUF4238 domain-containing protein n=1 Tax=Flavobacterium sp. TaxID=239 RepID=UPI0025B9FFDB|nr:DUF4238 domain-containing protein [Flavobacterium sp.]MBA4155717.1 hypothetical protein [Flavobacterium sp.]MBA4260395.1 hypothetical protein [Chitinophaga sp.]